MTKAAVTTAGIILLFVIACGCQESAPVHSISADEAQGLKMLEANVKDPGRDNLADEDIKTILRDNIDTDQQAVGLVVGIVDEHRARVISHGRMGDAASPEVNGDTLFEIGSITKVFTALLLQDMVERGEMKLDDPVQKYLPESVQMPTHGGKQITLLELATHTSALPREPDNVSPRSWRNPLADYTVEQLHAFLSHHKLRRDPGTQREYSNLGVALLGHVIARKAGKDYETLVVERICRPLGMDSTRITLTPQLEARLATGHALPDRPVVNFDTGILLGAGRLRSTANDLLKFTSAELGLTSSPLTALMAKARETHRTSSGLQVRLAWEDSPIFSHEGATFGYYATLGFDPGKHRGWVALSNCVSSRLATIIWGPLMNNRRPRPPRTAPIDVSLFDNYVGQYKSRLGEICSVRREGDRLMLQWFGQPGDRARYPSFEVFPQSETVFYNQLWDNRATFIRDAAGQATRLYLNDYPMSRVTDQPAQRPAPIRIASGTYDGYVGQYRYAIFFDLIKLGPTLNIYVEKDALGDHLMGYIPGVEGGELFPESETTYFNPLIADRGTFVRDKAGKATSINVRLNGSDLRLVRISDRPDH